MPLAVTDQLVLLTLYRLAWYISHTVRYQLLTWYGLLPSLEYFSFVS